jgi:lysozyme
MGGTNALGTILSTLAGGGSGLIAGSRKGAGADLRNIFKGLDLDPNFFQALFDKKEGVDLGGQQKDQPGIKVFPGAGASAPIQPIDPTTALDDEIRAPLFEIPEPSGDVFGGPGVQSISDKPEQVEETPETIFDAPMGPPVVQAIIQQPVIREVVTSQGKRRVQVDQLQQVGKQIDDDVDLLGAVPQLFESNGELTVEQVVRPITRMEDGMSQKRELPESLQGAAIDNIDSAPELSEPRVSEMLTINGSPIELGSIIDQTTPTASPDEATGVKGRVKEGVNRETEKLRINDDGLTVLEEFEGRRPHAYDDGAGNLTIGIGHKFTQEELDSGLVQINGEKVDWRDGLSDRQINRLAAQDMQVAADAVRTNVRVPLNQQQFNALVSFVFNVGVGAFKSSGALKALNNGDETSFLKRLQLWNKSGGSVSSGLQKRRAFEAAMFQQGEGE